MINPTAGLKLDWICWPVVALMFLLTLTVVNKFTGELVQELSIFESPAFTNVSLIPKVAPAWIEIDFGNGKKRVFQGELGEAYPLDLVLNSAADNGLFRIKIKDGRILEVAGVRNNGGVWNIYKEGQRQEDSVSQLKVDKGDRYKIVLE